MNFLTVEDYNSVITHPLNKIYILNTDKISQQEFTNILYDFCIVSHNISGDNHIYTIEIINDLWCGRVHAEYVNGSDTQEIPFSNILYDNNRTITITTTYNHITIYLYLCNFASFNFDNFNSIPTENFYLVTKDEIGTSKQIYFTNDNHLHSPQQITVSEGVQYYEVADYKSYILFIVKKTNLVFDLTNHDLLIGIVNHIPLNVDDDYLPNGSLVDEMLLDIVVKYDGKTISVEYDEEINDYCFDLDLTDKVDNSPIKLKVIVNEIDLVNSSISDFILPCTYPSANNFEELQNQLTMDAGIIELTDDIVFTTNLVIPNDVYIIGNDYQMVLDIYNITTNHNIVKCTNILFKEGSSCFIQDSGSKLVLTNCRFENALISDNYKGSVISANEEDTITELSNCIFLNCHHSIYVGGELKIDNCKARYNSWSDNIDVDYPAFATIYNGIVEISNSIFDIDYDITTLCSNEVDIKFAQSLLSLGEGVLFNNMNCINMKNNDTLPFFYSPYNNLSHIFAKYYYPQIEDCVISSPILDKEDKCVCHSILGNDWVYKNNVQITKVSWESENNIRKISWEDI